MQVSRTNNLAFGVKFKFLQNQVGLPCAYCGKPILSQIEFNDVYKALRNKKGKEIIPVLTPFLDRLEGDAQSFLRTVLNCAQESKYSDWSFKKLSMLGQEKKIYTPNDVETLSNILKDIRFSVEHTEPQSLGGLNISSNYVPMHVGCNSKRSSYSYSEMSVQNPKFPENIRACLAELKRRMISDRLGKTHYDIRIQDDYFPKVTDSIVKQGIDRKWLSDI